MSSPWIDISFQSVLNGRKMGRPTPGWVEECAENYRWLHLLLFRGLMLRDAMMLISVRKYTTFCGFIGKLVKITGWQKHWMKPFWACKKPVWKHNYIDRTRPVVLTQVGVWCIEFTTLRLHCSGSTVYIGCTRSYNVSTYTLLQKKLKFSKVAFLLEKIVVQDLKSRSVTQGHQGKWTD